MARWLSCLWVCLAAACSSSSPSSAGKPVADAASVSDGATDTPLTSSVGDSAARETEPAASSDAAVDQKVPPTSCATGALCDGQTGLCRDSALCSAARPCVDALVGINHRTVNEPLTLPLCKTNAPSRPVFDDGAPRTWTDAVNGDARAACVFKPAGTSSTAKRPLLVYLHGSGGSASAIYDSTSLRIKASTFDLSGDPARPGFVLAADQGRNMNVPNGNTAASRHEVYLRDLRSPSTSPDMRNLDRLIDELVAAGGIDERRIYVTGWSNGALFGQMYAIARHATATPGGNRVAAAAVFDGADPFARPLADEAGCDYRPLPRVAVPILVVHRSCSIMPCDEAQRVALDAPPGYAVTEWMDTLRTQIGATDVTQITLNAAGARITSCPALCTQAAATINHIRWPDGVADGSGKDWEIEMLDYLRVHPLP